MRVPLRKLLDFVPKVPDRCGWSQSAHASPPCKVRLGAQAVIIRVSARLRLYMLSCNAHPRGRGRNLRISPGSGAQPERHLGGGGAGRIVEKLPHVGTVRERGRLGRYYDRQHASSPVGRGMCTFLHQKTCTSASSERLRHLAVSGYLRPGRGRQTTDPKGNLHKPFR